MDWTKTIPREFYLGHRPHKIEVKKMKEHGHFHQHDFVIGLSPKQTAEEAANTLLHEMIHAIFRVNGVEMPDAQEEMVARLVANGLTAVFREDPKFIKWIGECYEPA